MLGRSLSPTTACELVLKGYSVWLLDLFNQVVIPIPFNVNVCRGAEWDCLYQIVVEIYI